MLAGAEEGVAARGDPMFAITVGEDDAFWARIRPSLDRGAQTCGKDSLARRDPEGLIPPERNHGERSSIGIDSGKALRSDKRWLGIRVLYRGVRDVVQSPAGASPEFEQQ